MYTGSHAGHIANPSLVLSLLTHTLQLSLLIVFLGMEIPSIGCHERLPEESTEKEETRRWVITITNVAPFLHVSYYQ